MGIISQLNGLCASDASLLTYFRHCLLKYCSFIDCTQNKMAWAYKVPILYCILTQLPTFPKNGIK